MKNYIANEQGGWATSTAYIRNSLRKAIELGRQGHHDERAMFEALRLLGQVLVSSRQRSDLLVSSHFGRSRRTLKLG